MVQKETMNFNVAEEEMQPSAPGFQISFFLKKINKNHSGGTRKISLIYSLLCLLLAILLLIAVTFVNLYFFLLF